MAVTETGPQSVEESLEQIGDHLSDIAVSLSSIEALLQNLTMPDPSRKDERGMALRVSNIND